MQEGEMSDKLRALFYSGKQLEYQKNEIIIRAHETPRGVYLIESGMIKVYSLSKQGDEHVHHFFGAGDFFPIIWPFRPSIRSMFYETLGPTVTWMVPRSKFKAFITKNSDSMAELMKELVNRYHLYTSRIDNLLYSDARERSAHRLLSLANRFGVKTPDGIAIDAQLTHEDLAHSINMTRETFGRAFGRLQEKNVIAYDDQHRLVIKDLPLLSQIIGIDETKAMWPELKRFSK